MVPRRMEDETTSARWRRWADESRQVARVWFSRSDIPSGAAGWPAKAGQMYDIFGTQSVFGEESLFLNFGYWENNPTTLDEASRDLARLVARSGDFNTSDIVVDCGTGYGDQDILWANEFGVKHITGVNVAPRQIEISTRRVEEAGLADRIDYVRASATDLPQEDESCTKVVALESAMHFPSRVEFFSEALRVLKPGGRLVTADIVPKRTFLNARHRKEVDRLGWRGASQKAARRAANVEAYRELLLDIGFAEAETRSIAGDIFRPLARFLSKSLFAPDRKYVNPMVRWTFRPDNFWLNEWHVDYILAVAQKT